jgi:hypothetical protein
MKVSEDNKPVQTVNEPAEAKGKYEGPFNLGDIKATLNTPTIRRVRSLKDEGFDIEDPDKINRAYFELTRSEEKMSRLIKIIFQEDIPADIIPDIPISEVKRGLYGFLGESGFVIL